MANLTIMVGLPRSGKSTWIKNNKKDSIVVSTDDIRKDIFDTKFFSNSEPFVSAIAKSMVVMLLKQGKDVIVDATHITINSRYQWVHIGRAYESNIKMVWMKTPLSECLNRNDNRDGKAVPEKVILEMNDSFEPPTKTYEIDLLIVSESTTPSLKA